MPGVTHFLQPRQYAGNPSSTHTEQSHAGDPRPSAPVNNSLSEMKSLKTSFIFTNPNRRTPDLIPELKSFIFLYFM